MQLLRAARAACTNLTLWVTSIGSSLLLGPIFSTVTITWRETRLVAGKKDDFTAGEKPVLSQLQRLSAHRPLIEIV